MAELLPEVLRRMAAEPKTLLDLACGEGTFALAMAKAGLEVTGLDLSEDMLEIARRRADEAGPQPDGRALKIKFVQADMRSFARAERFDLATCWYDSLNYLVEPDDLVAAFTAVARALAPGGLFIFDMNTTAGLAVMWRSQPFYVAQNTPEAFDAHINSFDFEKGIATKRIVGFIRRGPCWMRIDEEHRERAYTLGSIRMALKASGLEEVACWGSLEEMSEPAPEAGRVWFVAKPAAIC
jgi:ubiquinone/menaquinone biosynthesis C-methylase UbiE